MAGEALLTYDPVTGLPTWRLLASVPTGPGSGALAQRVHLSDEALAALESITVNVATVATQEFHRIENNQFFDNEEVRYELPVPTANGTIYKAVAPDGTAVSSPNWKIVRVYLDASGNPYRKRIKTGIAWSTRADAANWP